MTNSIVVRNLATSQVEYYSEELGPAKAVLTAHLRSKKNNNWWSYPEPQDHPDFVEGKWTVACGDWCAYKVKEIEIPAKYLDGTEPMIEGETLWYTPTGEQQAELTAAFGQTQHINVSLLSAHFITDDRHPAFKLLRVVSVDLEAGRFWVTVKTEALQN